MPVRRPLAARLASAGMAVTLGLAATAGSPAGAPPAAAGRPATWLRADSPPFVLFADGEAADLERLAASLEALRRTASTMAPDTELDAPVPTWIYLFRDPEGFEPFRLRAGGRPLETPGYLVPHEHGNFAALLAVRDQRPERYLYKQYLHYLLHVHFPRLPLWFRHGIAEIYGTFELDGAEAKIGLPVEEYLTVLRIHSERLIPAGRLFGFTHLPTGSGGPDDVDEQIFIAQSWALVHYLVLGDLGQRERVRAYLGRVQAGQEPRRAFREVFGLDDAAVDRALAEYVLRERFRFVRLPVPGAAGPPPAVRPLAGYEADSRLAALLLHTAPERRGEAEALLDRALAASPEHAPAWLGRGEAAALAGDAEAAHRAYERAVGLAPDDFIAQYLAGDARLAAVGKRRPESEQELAELRSAEAALGRCTELNPRFAPCRVRLGVAYNLEPRPVPEAVPVLERALAMLPGREDVAFNLLLAYARIGDAAGADALLARLPAMGADPALVARAREVRWQMLFQQATRLARDDRLDDAVALYARVEAETADPALRQSAGERLSVVAAAAEHNRFVAAYRDAVAKLAAGDREAAQAALDALAATARPGFQTEVVEALRAPPAGEPAGETAGSAAADLVHPE